MMVVQFDTDQTGIRAVNEPAGSLIIDESGPDVSAFKADYGDYYWQISMIRVISWAVSSQPIRGVGIR